MFGVQDQSIRRTGPVPTREVAVMMLMTGIDIALIAMIVAVVAFRSAGPRRARVRSTPLTRAQVRQEQLRRAAARRDFNSRY